MVMVNSVQLTDMREGETPETNRNRFWRGRWKVWVAWCVRYESGGMEILKRTPINVN